MHLLLPQLLFEQKLTLLMIFVYKFSLCPIIQCLIIVIGMFINILVVFLDNQLTVF